MRGKKGFRQGRPAWVHQGAVAMLPAARGARYGAGVRRERSALLAGAPAHLLIQLPRVHAVALLPKVVLWCEAQQWGAVRGVRSCAGWGQPHRCSSHSRARAAAGCTPRAAAPHVDPAHLVALVVVHAATGAPHGLPRAAHRSPAARLAGT